MGKTLITCETNLRNVADKCRSTWGRRSDHEIWGHCLHGAALSSVALLLRHTIGELIIPATHTYAQVKPWGSSPLLDHLWSDGHVKITHDGCEANRTAKVRRLAASDVAVESLRVCYHDTSRINCGHCEKCLRTMVALRLYDALDRARTLPRSLSMPELHALVIPSFVRHHYIALGEEARRLGDDELVKATEIILGKRRSLRHALARFKHVVRPTATGRVLRSLNAALPGRRPRLVADTSR